uniref:Uncharacterized protein n=1 Tax=Acrobeloides nanus TaxID=290746 RepID=A0A914CCV8_9BILA
MLRNRSLKFADKLCTNNFASDYKMLLSKLSWKTLGQLAMKRRATQGYKYARKVIDMPDDNIKYRCQKKRPTQSRIHTGNPTNEIGRALLRLIYTSRKIWNNLLRETCQINSLTNFKKAMKSPNIYEDLARKKIIRRKSMISAYLGLRLLKAWIEFVAIIQESDFEEDDLEAIRNRDSYSLEVYYGHSRLSDVYFALCKEENHPKKVCDFCLFRIKTVI